MEPREGEDRRTAAAERAFAVLNRRVCPPLADTLIAAAAAWRLIDRAAVDAGLDALARPLFAVEPTGEARARALAELVARTFQPDTARAEGLWLDEVLALRRGHPVLIAAVAVELGRRAGWETSVLSAPTGWYAGLCDGDRLWLIDMTGGAGGPGMPEMVRRHCGHELAFVVLTGLAERFTSPRDAADARALRDCLAVFSPPEDPGPALLGALWSATGTPR